MVSSVKRRGDRETIFGEGKTAGPVLKWRMAVASIDKKDGWV
jgi:hypothetical protein